MDYTSPLLTPEDTRYLEAIKAANNLPPYRAGGTGSHKVLADQDRANARLEEAAARSPLALALRQLPLPEREGYRKAWSKRLEAEGSQGSRNASYLVLEAY